MGDIPLELSKPPIVEAALRMAFNPPPDISWELICTEVLRRLPDYKQTSALSVDGSMRVLTAGTSDGLHTFRLARGEFIFSRLAPYVGWEAFKGEARKVWHEVISFLGNASVHTFGLRYINRLHFPVNTPIVNYLRLFPLVPMSEDGIVRNFFNVYLRVTLQLEKPQGILTVQEIQLPPEDPALVTFALDNQFDFAGVGLSDGLIWDQLELARALKNQYFVEFLSPSFLETFR